MYYKCICQEWTPDELNDVPSEVIKETIEVGHKNQAGGYCCPHHGNTCGFHQQYNDANYLDDMVSLIDLVNSLALQIYKGDLSEH